jgi:hypothetical protein
MRIRYVMVFTLSAVGFTGCALYSETRDKQAQEALKAWEEVDLNAQVAIPRKNLAVLLGQQMDVQDELALAKRDNLARAIATGGTIQDTLVGPVGVELNKLAGSVDLAVIWRDEREKEQKVKHAFAVAGRQLRWLRLEIPDCATLAKAETTSLITNWKGTPAQAGILSASTSVMKAECEKADFNATAKVGVGGTLLASREKLVEAEKKLQDQRDASILHRNNYRAALAEYELMAAAVKREPNANRKKMLEAAAKLKTAADALAGFEDAFSVQFLAEQKRDALNEALSTILNRPEGGALPDNASRATIALAIFPDLLDKANQAFADAKKPTLVPLLLQKDLEQIKADAAKRDVDAQLTKIAMLEQLLTTQSRQVDHLLKARDALQGMNGSIIAAEALGKRSPPTEQKMRLWRATSFYLDAVGRLSGEADKIDYKVLALERERALAYAESNIHQWGTLIGSSVRQMAQFGASGIKSSNLTALINSATLLAIAIGTNK